ncbi:PREDICTED: NADH dehydrogenase [ubiquinone] iron-sulfur protein 4, mitochondrial-like [Rhagoletis zephyria]|uniref:NADH dehydrogenase [ubiquinone] iron-sulfur protein 4, mitochondrial-like n=1 Tax=Rhagoletis zephyria TaxID=28612 RepID=UPI00081155A7|nr:PREDICTED: NADH dehydrogenase [ubiquinone] iron-sulfur protein 4, mitochondrial-like [Rhagoletis zephyria]
MALNLLKASASRLNAERTLFILSQRLLASKGNSPKGELLVREDTDLAIADADTAERRSHLQKLRTTAITVDQPNLLSVVSGVPEEHIVNRRVRIYKQAKNAMQSGTYDTQKWKLDYENRERWENPLMGWTSTGDPLSNLNLYFSSKEDAIEYCERHGLTYQVDEPQERKKLHKLYADNFSWSKRTRVGSK